LEYDLYEGKGKDDEPTQHTEAQMMAALKQMEAGRTVKHTLLRDTWRRTSSRSSKQIRLMISDTESNREKGQIRTITTCSN
jgi:hypothetical protein